MNERGLKNLPRSKVEAEHSPKISNLRFILVKGNLMKRPNNTQVTQPICKRSLAKAKQKMNETLQGYSKMENVIDSDIGRFVIHS